MLGRLSSDEQETYERLSRPATRPLMARAIRLHDQELLAELVARFGASRQGVEAARLLTDLALEERMVLVDRQESGR